MDDIEQDETADSPAEEQLETSPEWDPATQVIEDAQQSLARYGRTHELIQEELEFVLDQKQYDDPQGHARGDDEVEAVDQSLLSACRRKWSQVKAAPIYLNCFPQNQTDGDPNAAERMKWALEHTLYSPKNLFRRKRARALMGAIVGRCWYVLMEWNADLKDILFSTHSMADVLRQPGTGDLHDPATEWCVLRRRITVRDARARARRAGVPEDEVMKIVADSDGTSGQTSSRGNGSAGSTSLDLSNPEGGPSGGVRGTVVLLTGMYRFDPKQAFVEEALGAPEKLPPEEQYMQCWTCGHEDHAHHMDATTGELPATGMPCPQCAADPKFDGAESDTEVPMLERVDTVQQIERYAECPDGRWIDVLEESRVVLYNDCWPYMKPNGETLRSFPMFEYRIYDDPRPEHTHSDVSWQFNQQALATHIMQWGVQQMRNSGRIIMMPRGALVDSRGRAVTPNNRLDQIAWIKDPMLAKAIQEFQPSGLPSGWTELLAAATQSFRSNLGTGELGLGPDDSKNLPVGTTHAIIESGDIPVDDAISSIRDSDAEGFGVLADMIQCCWDAARWIRYLGPEGQMAYEYISAADLTGVDVEVMGAPQFDVLQGAKMERMTTWFNLLPPQQRLAAKWLNLPPSEVWQYQQDMAAFMGAGAGGAGPPGMPGVGGAGAPAGPQSPPRPQTQGGPPVAGTQAVPGLAALSPQVKAGLESMSLSR